MFTLTITITFFRKTSNFIYLNVMNVQYLFLYNVLISNKNISQKSISNNWHHFGLFWIVTWYKQLLWLLLEKLGLLFNPTSGAAVINKFSTILRRHIWLWLVKNSYGTYNSQSKCFIYATLKFVYDITNWSHCLRPK